MIAFGNNSINGQYVGASSVLQMYLGNEQVYSTITDGDWWGGSLAGMSYANMEAMTQTPFSVINNLDNATWFVGEMNNHLPNVSKNVYIYSANDAFSNYGGNALNFTFNFLRNVNVNVHNFAQHCPNLRYVSNLNFNQIFHNPFNNCKNLNYINNCNFSAINIYVNNCNVTNCNINANIIAGMNTSTRVHLYINNSVVSKDVNGSNNCNIYLRNSVIDDVQSETNGNLFIYSGTVDYVDGFTYGKKGTIYIYGGNIRSCQSYGNIYMSGGTVTDTLQQSSGGTTYITGGVVNYVYPYYGGIAYLSNVSINNGLVYLSGTIELNNVHVNHFLNGTDTYSNCTVIVRDSWINTMYLSTNTYSKFTRINTTILHLYVNNVPQQGHNPLHGDRYTLNNEQRTNLIEKYKSRQRI